jgi:hypothetical protein
MKLSFRAMGMTLTRVEVIENRETSLPANPRAKSTSLVRKFKQRTETRRTRCLTS